MFRYSASWTGIEPWSGSLRRVVEEEEANERSRSRRRMKKMPLKSCMMLGVSQSLSNNSSKGGGVGVEIFLVPLCYILGDPGAVSGGRKKSKRATKNSGEEKSRTRIRAPGDRVLTDQFQTVGVILASDWCQKIFVFFCPITEQQDYESFRVFLHERNIHASCSPYVGRGFTRGAKFHSQQKM